jgi:3D (Asp-Asp-Asp) domain-containing protein
MQSNERDRIWVFASVMFALFLLLFSGLAIQYAVDPVVVGSEAELEDGVLYVNAVREIQPAAEREFLATAYCVTGVTKSGVRVSSGIVAADPSVLPIGSIIEIDAGQYSGIYAVMDTGGSVKGHRIDIFIPDYDEAVAFGARRISVRILRHGWNPQGAYPLEG